MTNETRRAVSRPQTGRRSEILPGIVVVSRQALIDSKFSTVICVPVFTHGQGLATQVPVGPGEGLKHESWIMCDNLVSLRKTELSHFIGSLPPSRLRDVDRALKLALALD